MSRMSEFCLRVIVQVHAASPLGLYIIWLVCSSVLLIVCSARRLQNEINECNQARECRSGRAQRHPPRHEQQLRATRRMKPVFAEALSLYSAASGCVTSTVLFGCGDAVFIMSQAVSAADVGLSVVTSFVPVVDWIPGLSQGLSGALGSAVRLFFLK